MCTEIPNKHRKTILGFEGRKKAVFNFRELDFFYDNATILNVNGKLSVLLNFLTNT